MITTLTERTVFKDKFEENKANQKKHELWKTINSGIKDALDREAFKKSPEETALTYSVKKRWKEDMKKRYPDVEERKKHNNP